MSSVRIRPRWHVVIVTIFLLMFEYVIVSPLIRARLDASRLAALGTQTEAHVFYPGYQTDLSYVFVDLHSLSYQFTAADPKTGHNLVFSDSQFVSGATLRRFNVGDQVTISYLPSKPTISRLSGRDADDTDLSDFPLFTALAVPILVGLWVGWKWLRGRSKE